MTTPYPYSIASLSSGWFKIATPEIVKALLPRSAFTKSGPGVRDKIRSALATMTPNQRKLARRRGWDRGLVREDGRVVAS